MRLTVVQEYNRIRLVRERNQRIKEGKANKIANFDTRGLQFCFFPELNTWKDGNGGFLEQLDSLTKQRAETKEKGDETKRLELNTSIHNLIDKAVREIVDRPQSCDQSSKEEDPRKNDFDFGQAVPSLYSQKFYKGKDGIYKKIASCDQQGIVSDQASQDQDPSSQKCQALFPFMEKIPYKEASAGRYGRCGDLCELEEQVEILSEIKVKEYKKKNSLRPFPAADQQDADADKGQKDCQHLEDQVPVDPALCPEEKDQQLSPQNAGKHHMGIRISVKGTGHDQFHNKVIRYFISGP
jgi:hypothetical protein